MIDITVSNGYARVVMNHMQEYPDDVADGAVATFRPTDALVRSRRHQLHLDLLSVASEPHGYFSEQGVAVAFTSRISTLSSSSQQPC